MADSRKGNRTGWKKIQLNELKSVYVMLIVWRKRSNSSASEFHEAFDVLLCDDFFFLNMLENMGFSWKIKEIQIAKGDVSKGKYPKREKIETEFAKDCFHDDLAIIWLSLICIYLISTKIRVHLRFADDEKVQGIINTDNNHCIKFTI